MKKNRLIEDFIIFLPIILFVVLSIIYYNFITNLSSYAPDFYKFTQNLRTGNTLEFIVLIVLVIYMLALPLMIFNLSLDIMYGTVKLKSILYGIIAPPIFVLFYAILVVSVHLFFTVLITGLKLIAILAIVTLPFSILYNKLKPK